MGELLEGFCKLIKSDEDVMSIAELMSADEIKQWELLVKCFRDINVTTIGADLESVNDFYKLERWQEMAILALVKHFELMIKTAQEDGQHLLQLKESLKDMKHNIEVPSYDGMFG